MKYKAGDRVKIKSLDWYNENKDEIGDVDAGLIFDEDMSMWCGKTMTILEVHQTYYTMEEECPSHYWTDEMIECKVEEETKPNTIEEAKTYWDSIKDAWICPDGYIFKDENGNVINATKIVLEKKKKEYPKTYEECLNVLGYEDIAIHCIFHTEADERLFDTLYSLKVCRDAYWKIAGEEMGLGKPWEPDWNTSEPKYVIAYTSHGIEKQWETTYCKGFAFPTEEMRDAFYENFKEEIEQCKELL